MKAQEKKSASDPVVERLRCYQVSRGLAWHRVAERLGLTRGMIMMVLRGDRRLSAKALFRLEQAEKETAEVRSAAERIVEGLIGEQNAVSQVLGISEKHKKRLEVPIYYEPANRRKSFPKIITLHQPNEENCRKLRSLFAETLDTRLIALGCLPIEFRNERFIESLTVGSRTRLINASLNLVMPDWRSFVTGRMS